MCNIFLTIEKAPFDEMVEVARPYIRKYGGFEKFADWGMVRGCLKVNAYGRFGKQTFPRSSRSDLLERGLNCV